MIRKIFILLIFINFILLSCNSNNKKIIGDTIDDTTGELADSITDSDMNESDMPDNDDLTTDDPVDNDTEVDTDNSDDISESTDDDMYEPQDTDVSDDITDDDQIVERREIVIKGKIRDFPYTQEDFFSDNPGGHSISYSSTCPTNSDPTDDIVDGITPDLVTENLGGDGKPILNLSSENVGPQKCITSADSFSYWFTDTAVDGIPEMKDIELTLLETETGSGVFAYENSDFFPIDNELFGNDIINHPEHNYHFTFQVHLIFTYKKGQVFTFRGDDDVWVYIDEKRVIDLGGVHATQEQTINLDDIEGLQDGRSYNFDLFFAERNPVNSSFKITTSINFNKY